MALPLIAVLALLALWTLYWFIASGIVQANVADERAKLVEGGKILTCAHEAWGGYPFRFEVTCDRPKLELENGLAVQSVKLQALAQAYDPGHIIALLDGPTTLNIPSQPAVAISHDPVIGSYVASQAKGDIATVEFRNVVAAPFGTLTRAVVSLRKRSDDLQDFALDATGLTMTTGLNQTLAVDSLTVDATLADQTTFTLNSAKAIAGKLKATAQGSIMRDANNRPEGTVAITLSDPAEAALIAAQSFKLTPEQQSALTAALTLMGGKANLVAKDGQLSLGPLPIATLPPLN
jgi:hypothetical protein